jgi:hypothetical protein
MQPRHTFLLEHNRLVGAEVVIGESILDAYFSAMKTVAGFSTQSANSFRSWTSAVSQK